MKNKENLKKSGIEATNKKVEILYQKLGSRWYSFSVIADEVFIGSIPEDEFDFNQGQEMAFKGTLKSL